MDQKSVTKFWRFENSSGVNPNTVFVETAHHRSLHDTSGLVLVYVSWINDVPYAHGYPATQCTEDGNTLVLKKFSTSPPPEPKATDVQVGGQHYLMPIQPFEFSMANALDPMQHTILKYVVRFRKKNGIQDLEKARHTIDLLIQWEKDHATTDR